MDKKGERLIYTPNNIRELQSNEIFVFGSDLKGYHCGGAAKLAFDSFGAVWGAGNGLNGQSYAIPSMFSNTDAIEPYVNQFINYAINHSELTFLVTRIGCGVAGFKDEQIAVLFKRALALANIILPESFVRILMTTNQIEMPMFLKNKSYGQTQTLVDLLIELNNRNKYRSPQEAIDGVRMYVDRLQMCVSSDISFLFSMRNLVNIEYCFKNGVLDIDKLRDVFLMNFDYHIDTIYKNYIVEKLVLLISYLNDFRRYSDVSILKNDLQRIFTSNRNYFEMGSPAMNYIESFFTFYVNRFWNKMTENGILNNKTLYDVMIGKHANNLLKYGLERVIEQNYKRDYCHSEVYAPDFDGAGPVYVETCFYSNSSLSTYNRRYVKSCGEGKGPNSIADIFEFGLCKNILREDEKYKETMMAFIPKTDFSLPVFLHEGGLLLFVNESEKIAFIKEHLSELPYDGDSR